MITIVRTATVRVPQAEVWDVLADFAAISSWAPNVDHSCLMTDRVDGVGAVRRIQTGRTTVVETVTTHEPPRSLGYRITGLPPVVDSVVNTWTLDPAGDSTAVTLTTEITPGPRPPQRVVARAVGRAITKASEQMLGGLTSHLETRIES